MGSLTGRVALVTGAGRRRGIGRGIAVELARAGADVAVHARAWEEEPPWAPQEIERLGRRACVLEGDLTDRDVVARVVAEATERLGAPDVLVNNAGVAGGAGADALLDLDDELWYRTVDVNLNAVYLVTKAALRGMVDAGRGSIVNISSVAGRAGQPRMGAYVATKFALVGLTQQLALEYAPIHDGRHVRPPRRGRGHAGGDREGHPHRRSADAAPGRPGGHRPRRRLPGVGRRRLDHRADAERRRRTADGLMGYVKTADEIAALEERLRAPRFVHAQKLTVEFLTEPATVERLLPPGFSPAARPSVTAMVGRWQSNCVGDFAGGALYVAARWEDLEGGYVLAMWMDSDRATIYGRDLYGEPKKLARSALHRSASRVTGHVERDGVRLLDLAGELEYDLGPSETERRGFNVKARPAADGSGLEEDAIVTSVVNRDTRRVHLTGPGAVRLTGTAHDPVDELEVVEVLGASYVEGDAAATNRRVGTIPAAAYLPYFHGRHADDWTALDTEAEGGAPLTTWRSSRRPRP
jgi:acetoacetate decarboxylase